MRTLGVLIAEEKELIAARLAAHLEGLGHRILGIVKDGHTAVASAWRLQPDLILLDLHLPSLDGIEAARAILARRAIPVILLTGYSAADLVRRAQEAGVLDCLVTPADAPELGAAIEAALTRFGELQALREEVGDLQQALRARMVVEWAKKALVRRLGLSEPEAFRYLRRRSRSTGPPLRELAAHILTADALLFGEPSVVRCLEVIIHTLGQAKGVPPPRVA